MKSLARKIYRHVASLPAEITLGVTNLPPISAHLERRHAAATARHRDGAALSGAEAAVVQGLTQHGVFVTDLASLGLATADGASIMADGGALAATLADRLAAVGQGVSATVTNTADDLLGRPSVYRFGLHPTLLRIVEAYLQRPAAYDGPIVFHTPADNREAGTRKWHLDREDRRVVKVALYLHDVDDETGPFQILAHRAQNIDGRFAYPVLDTAALEQRATGAAPSDPVTCLGKAGTLVFAETARFYHRGKPAIRQSRSAIFYGYFARPPRNPFFCERSRLSRSQILRLTEGLSHEQCAAALWRDALPWPVRLIPASVV